MKKLTFLLCFALGLLTVTHARPFLLSGAGLSMDVPAGWSARLDPGTASLQIDSPDGLVSLTLIQSDPDKLADLLDLAAGLVEAQMPDAAFGEPVRFLLNGMDTVEVEGQASYEGEPVRLSLDIIQARVPVVVIGYFFPGSEIHLGALEAFIKSLKWK